MYFDKSAYKKKSFVYPSYAYYFWYVIINSRSSYFCFQQNPIPINVFHGPKLQGGGVDAIALPPV